MYITNISIKNFRAIKDISIDLAPYINVVVGPNGVGKTTILQAVRLSKALNAPRTQAEAQQVLISLNAASPHFPQRLFLSGLTGEPDKFTEIHTYYKLTPEEIACCEAEVAQITRNFVAARLGLNFANPAQLLQFLQSPEGSEATKRTTDELKKFYVKLRGNPIIHIGISFHAGTGQFNIFDPLAGALLSFLDQRLPPSLSKFSFFPADRALPSGEVNLQLGGPDAQMQLEMHNSQPQLKYQRLKNLIINSIVFDGLDGGIEKIKEEFEKIFTELLKGRTIHSVSVNELGLLSVMTTDTATGRLVELDSLSSGEKNVVLTFLIVAKSLSNESVALFDEPELHLNPAVTRDLIPFMLRQYAKPRQIQFLLCSHSPEILASTFVSEECALLHLKTATDITKISKSARHEYSEALKKLGTSVGESLLYKGTILVEGITDVSFMEIAFPEYYRDYKIKDRGGRKEIEKTIKELQEIENQGQNVTPIFIIFDMDEEFSDLTSSAGVKILQWDRRCIENYMLGGDVLSQILANPKYAENPINSAGEVERLIRELAFEQLETIAARDVYRSYEFSNSSLQKDDLSPKGIEAIAERAAHRWIACRDSLPTLLKEDWKADFVKRCTDRKAELSLSWNSRWRELCDGKKLISDLHKRIRFRLSESSLFEIVARTMRDIESEDWLLLRDKLKALISN